MRPGPPCVDLRRVQSRLSSMRSSWLPASYLSSNRFHHCDRPPSPTSTGSDASTALPISEASRARYRISCTTEPAANSSTAVSELSTITGAGGIFSNISPLELSVFRGAMGCGGFTPRRLITRSVIASSTPAASAEVMANRRNVNALPRRPGSARIDATILASSSAVNGSSSGRSRRKAASSNFKRS